LQGGGIQQNKAKNEFAQHLVEDPLPLRKAKNTTEAAKKKADKTKEIAEEKLCEAYLAVTLSRFSPFCLSREK